MMTEEGQVSGSNSSSMVEFNRYLCLRAQPARGCSGDKLWFQLKISVQDSVAKHKKRKKGQNRMDEEHVSGLDCLFQTKVFPSHSCCIATGSLIYSLGSVQHQYGGFGRCIRFFDLEHPENEWKLGPSMITRRSDGAAAVIGNKIYMFGGTRPTSPKKKPWAEVLDRDRSHWTSLADPPVNICSQGLLAFVLSKSDHSAKILLCSLDVKGLYIYEVISDSWQVLNENFCFMGYRSNPVLVDSTLYWIGEHYIHAYNLMENKKFFGPIDSLEIERMLRGTPDWHQKLLLVHLCGDLYCCIWVESKFRPDLSLKSGFRCVKLQISEQTSLRAVSVSTQYYPTDFHFDNLDCILLDKKCSSLRNPGEKNIRTEGVIGQQNGKGNEMGKMLFELQKLMETSAREGEIWRSCPTPLPEFEKSIIFRAEAEKPRESFWYVLNLSSKKNERLWEMFRTCEVVLPNKCSSVVLDNVVYSLGGRKHLDSPHFRRSVWCANFKRPKLVWKTIDQKMISGRSCAASVVLDGKIYIFGGLKPDYQGKKKPWGEFFDINKGQWTGLADPPLSCLFSNFDVFAFVMNDDKYKIFVASYNKNGMYVYNALSDSWEVFDKDFNIRPCITKPALAGSTLYWVGFDAIRGYDLGTKKSFFGPIDSLEIERFLYNHEEAGDRCGYRPVFLNLHGEDLFGMIWIDFVMDDNSIELDIPLKSAFHCTYLRVSRHIDEGGVVYLKAFSISAQVYPTNAHLTTIDGIISDGEFSGMRKLERCSTSESKEMGNVGDSPF